MKTVKRKSRRRTSTIQKTMKFLKELGFTAEIVEKKIPYKFISIDFLGVIDIIALREGIGTLGIQSTTNTGGQHAKHLAKCLASEKLALWLRCGNRFEIFSWAKQGARGKRKKWTLRREEIKAGDFAGGHSCLIAGDEARAA